VSLVDAGKIADYTDWRVNQHDVRDITIRHDLHALSSFFQFAIRKHWTKRNPIDDVEIPSDADAVRMHVLTSEEEMDYFKRAKEYPNLHGVGRLMVNRGMRPEEVTALAKLDIDMDRGLIHIRKGKSTASKRVLNRPPNPVQFFGAGWRANLHGSFRRKGGTENPSAGLILRAIALSRRPPKREESQSASSRTIYAIRLRPELRKRTSTCQRLRLFSGTLPFGWFKNTFTPPPTTRRPRWHVTTRRS
jgi:integrase